LGEIAFFMLGRERQGGKRLTDRAGKRPRTPFIIHLLVCSCSEYLTSVLDVLNSLAKPQRNIDDGSETAGEQGVDLPEPLFTLKSR
jgi:hypothetical protein